MPKDFAKALRDNLERRFVGARQIIVLEERGGRLVPAGDHTSAQITGAAMLLASVQIRAGSQHAYFSETVPGAALLPLLERTDRGSIVLAPVLDRGLTVGFILVEAERGHAFSRHDLTSLEAIAAKAGDGMGRRLRPPANDAVLID